MKGYRTLIVNLIAVAASMAGIYGIDIPAETQAEIATGIVALLGVVNMVLRTVTTTPVGKKE